MTTAFQIFCERERQAAELRELRVAITTALDYACRSDLEACKKDDWLFDLLDTLVAAELGWTIEVKIGQERECTEGLTHTIR